MNQRELELRAYLALQGGSAAPGVAGSRDGWRGDVAAALQSEADLSRDFRDALAAAILGNLNGFRLDLNADHGVKKRRQDHHAGVLIRRQRIEIGSLIEDLMSGGMAAHAAIKAASQKNSPGTPSYKGCELALTYTRRLKAWREELNPDSALLQELGEAIDDLFHASDADGNPLDQPPNRPKLV